MTACLSDYVVWSLSEGYGTAEEREHRERCTLCAGRANRLAAELRAIVQVLGDEPPSTARREPFRLPLPRVALAAAVLAIAVGISLLAQRPPPLTPVSEDDGIAGLSEMSTDVFDDGELVSAPSATDVVGAALSAAAPCEWQLDGCQDIALSLF